MNETTEMFLLNRELDKITLEYYWAPFNLKSFIIKDILHIQKAIRLLLKEK